MMWTSVGKPCARCQSGGGPLRAASSARWGSRAARKRTPRASVRSSSVVGTVTSASVMCALRSAIVVRLLRAACCLLQLVQGLLQGFELLPRLGQFALRSEPLVVVELLVGALDELLHVRRRRLRRSRLGLLPRALFGRLAAGWRGRARLFTEEAGECVCKARPEGEPFVCGDDDEAQLRHRA